MSKNTGRGGKKYRKGNHKSIIQRQLILKEDGTVYGQILKMLGSGRVEVYCFDSVKRIGNIRGKMKKKVWIGVGDVVLISLRDFQNEKCDVIFKYTSQEVRQLKVQQQIPDNIQVNQNDSNQYVDFSDGQDSNNSEDDDFDDQLVKPKIKDIDINDI